MVLVPILWPTQSPDHPDYIRALIYNPPPPPPPPLPKGSAMMEKQEPAKPVTPDPEPDTPKFTADIPKEDPLKHEARDKETEQAGSPNGSDIGVPEGMEEGVEGGVVGGVPGGVLGGVIGGTGDGVVMDYDQGPRPIKITQPKYPPEAFVKKIEGTVEVEILIDSTGRVSKARVVRSIPALDDGGAADRAAVGLLARDQERAAGGYGSQRARHVQDLLSSRRFLTEGTLSSRAICGKS